MKRIFLKALVFALLFSSCNDDDVFNKEMYKNVVALISTNYYNTFQDVVPLTQDGEYVEGYIAACSGGTHAPTKDLVIDIKQDSSALYVYNKSLYDTDESRYAKFLSSDKYELTKNEITIKAGERVGKTLVKIYPQDLSPDSTYFIGLKATEDSNVEINPDKSTILYQILIKNEYASQASNTFYSMSGLVNNMVTSGYKKMFPLTANSVRIIAGTESFESDINHINQSALRLKIDSNHNVTIEPYKDLEVTQINGDPKYPNIFVKESYYGHTYNVFLLSYEYTYKGKSKLMKEELRFEVIQ